MKKFTHHILTATILTSLGITNITHAVLPKPKPQSEASIIGQQAIRELGENVEKANTVFEFAVGEDERQMAMKNARDAAHTLINALNDIKTFGNDIIRGYNPAQRRQAAIALAELLMRKNAQEIKIKSNRMKIADMTNSGLVFDTAVTGKSEARDMAIRKQKELYAELRSIKQAIADQETILGKEWTRTIRIAINSLMSGGSIGIAYGIDWYAIGHSAKLLGDDTFKQPVMQQVKPMRIRKQKQQVQKITPQQRAAIREWKQLSKSKLLSKEIATAYELTQAQNLVAQLERTKQDLINLPPKNQPVLDKIIAAIDSLNRKIERAKGNLINNKWIK